MKKIDLEILSNMRPCSPGFDWARKQPSLKVAWDKCKEPSWLFWYLARKAPLEKGVSVSLAILFARRSLAVYEKMFPKDNRPRAAIEAAEAYAKVPIEKNKNAAAYAANAAYAAYAAYAAAYAVAAKRACYERMADKLLMLIAECNGKDRVVALGIAI